MDDGDAIRRKHLLKAMKCVFCKQDFRYEQDCLLPLGERIRDECSVHFRFSASGDAEEEARAMRFFLDLPVCRFL